MCRRLILYVLHRGYQSHPSAISRSLGIRLLACYLRASNPTSQRDCLRAVLLDLHQMSTPPQ